MLARFKFIYFDLDDTLLDHKGAEKAALGDVHGNFTMFDSVDPENLINIYHEVNSEQWQLYGQGKVDRKQLQRNRFENTLAKLNLDAGRFEEVGNYYMSRYQQHWRWIDGAPAAFNAIRDKFGVGILTNGFSETQKKKFERFKLYEQVQHIVISEDVGILKPQPGIFDYATKLTGQNPDEILYIGDSYSSDIIGGSSYGWTTAWFTSNGDAAQGTKADFVFSNFDELRRLLNV